MLVVADENMPYAREFFSRFGEVRLVAGRAIRPAHVRDADLLMVRSVTKVGPELLEGSRVRFVGTATIGTDHVDQAWLAERGIAFASAPGCNAESVAQYMASALCWVSRRLGRPLGDCSIGIVGVGNCGSRVARVAAALGMRVVLNDPPLARATGDPKYRPLAEALKCDYVALHVPLTRQGEDATLGLIGGDALDRMGSGAVVINACRGGVLDEGALLGRLDQGWIAGAVLDAWIGEPAISLESADRVMLGTPHIAGYSHDGKFNGTRMVYEAACRALELPIEPVEIALPPAPVERITLEGPGRRFDSVLAELVLRAYPIDRDDGDLRREVVCEGAGLRFAFDALRKHYPLRREFSATRVRIDAPDKTWPLDWRERIAALGFALEPAPLSGQPA